MFFHDWFSILRVVVVGTLAYVGLLVVLRATGKRTLSKMSAFDLIVTVALGSTLATVLLSRDVALLEGLAALTLLVALQFCVTWLSVRSPTVTGIVKATPTLLFYDGAFLGDPMRRERVTEGEITAAIRAQGLAASGDVLAVVLETDGELSVVRRPGAGSHADTLDGVATPSAPDGG